MDLAREMRGLDSFVHVSTAYAHCHLQNEVLQEKGRIQHLIKITITSQNDVLPLQCIRLKFIPPRRY